VAGLPRDLPTTCRGRCSRLGHRHPPAGSSPRAHRHHLGAFTASPRYLLPRACRCDLIPDRRRVSPVNSAVRSDRRAGLLFCVSEAYIPPTVGAVSPGLRHRPPPRDGRRPADTLPRYSAHHAYIGIHPPLDPTARTDPRCQPNSVSLVRRRPVNQARRRPGIRPGYLITALNVTTPRRPSFHRRTA